MEFNCEEIPIFSCIKNSTMTGNCRTCEADENPHDVFYKVTLPIWFSALIAHNLMVVIMYKVMPCLDKFI